MTEKKEIPDWKNPPDLWEWDGSLRDIRILGTKLADWERFIEILHPDLLQYTYDNEVRNIPPVNTIFENQDGSHFMSINIGNMNIHVFFNTPDEISMTADPREVENESDHNLLLDFMKIVSENLNKKIYISAPGQRDPKYSFYILYNPINKIWQTG